ncbi:uncharacterized protein SCHCODRAFT_02671733 [Schizophyllum commune H4-8]|nr:uncharacterized protein SCHCODRAFT_02671733 [Schizophyllum commune H4-8]KAI5887769.1 hypothetical protein SCHCODRAFT_02671733 [Schizophyllum commune H4-8]
MEAPPLSLPEGSQRTPTDSRQSVINPRRIPMDSDGVYTHRDGYRSEAAHKLCASACAPDSASVHRRFASTTMERRTGLEIMADVLEKLDQVGKVVRLASDIVARAEGDAANAHVSSPSHPGGSQAVPHARSDASHARSSPLRTGGSTSPAASTVFYSDNSSHASAHSNTLNRHSHPDVARHPIPTVARISHADTPHPPPNITRIFNFLIAWMKRSPDTVVPHVCRSAPLVSSPAVLVALVAYVAWNPRQRNAPAYYDAQTSAHAHDTPAPQRREAREASQLAFECLAHYLVQCGEGRRDERPEDAPMNRQGDTTHTHYERRYPSQPPSGDLRPRSSPDCPLSGDSRDRQNERRNIWLAYLADLEDHNARAFVYDCTMIVHRIDSESERNVTDREQGYNTTECPGQGHRSIANQGHYQTVSHGHYVTVNRGQNSMEDQDAFLLRRCLMDDALYVARRLQQRGVALSELHCGSELLKALSRVRSRYP